MELEKAIVALVAITFAVIAVLWIKANKKKGPSAKPGNGGALPNTDDKKEHQAT